MNWNTAEGLKSLLKELVGVPSISATKGEVDAANKVYELLSNLNYFKQNPKHLKLHPLPGDGLGRYIVTALVKSKPDTTKTVILFGHIDTVDIEDFGALKDYAFDPDVYTQKLNPDQLDASAREDLQSGDWLFGRGVMDMKCGVAMQMALIQKASLHPDEYNGNLLLVVVPDEESNSMGMVKGIRILNELSKQHNLEYLVAIDSEPQFPKFPGDTNNYIYTGTIGKLVPIIFCVGKETHVGDSLSGLNPNLLMSEVTRQIEINVDLSDSDDDLVTPPPTCLKQKDLKKLYSAQTPTAAVAYYNYLTLKKSPREVYRELESICYKAFENVLENFKLQHSRYARRAERKVPNINWKPKVYSYNDVYNMAKKAYGQKFVNHMERFFNECRQHKTMDERDLVIKIISEVHSFCPDREPMIIIAFTPPYYPHVSIDREKSKHRKVEEVAKMVVEKARAEFNEKLSIEKYFTGLSDMSYFALSDAEDVLKYLKPNIPSWGINYSIPLEDIKELDLPVLNIGPYGKDAHKFTERLHVPYSLNVAPRLLEFAVKKILE